jgi:hypothetical protein
MAPTPLLVRGIEGCHDGGPRVQWPRPGARLLADADVRALRWGE